MHRSPLVADTSTPSAQDAANSRSFLYPTVPATSLSTTMLKTDQILATHLHGIAREAGMSQKIPVGNANVVSIQLRSTVGAEVWKHGHHVPTEAFHKGTFFLGHLADEPTAYMPNEFECVILMIPQVSLMEICQDQPGGAYVELRDVDHGEDAVLFHLGMALKLAMRQPDIAGSLLLDQLSLAIGSRLCSAYGSPVETRTYRRRVLTRREQRIATDLMTADLEREPSLAEVAAACGLPTRQFVDAFRASTGMSPYRWLRAFRVERAKGLMQTTSLELSDIAYACGFADQSHFTRVFSAMTGCTPGLWRRARQT
ncbi:AraC family transcriptional regulator [Pandoraea sp. PE-S2T-3]|uniref:AraC family transcriptional regulator n=2 Tax=unclassified Pandoraea TaxID=2624094 RepID=UPI000B3F8CC2|nr:AraC family transcriptional regulator [Pandoraea sp. PE-S2T-3]